MWYLRRVVLGLEHCPLGELGRRLSLLESSSLSLLTVGTDAEELDKSNHEYLMTATATPLLQLTLNSEMTTTALVLYTEPVAADSASILAALPLVTERKSKL